jgi:DNA polymerase-1
MLAAQVLDSGLHINKKHEEGYFSLKGVCERYLGITLDKNLQKSDWSADALSDEQLRYAAIDAAILLPLHQILMQEAENAGVTIPVDIENRAVPQIAAMGVNGMAIDRVGWDALADEASEETQELRRKLDEIVEAGLGADSSLPQPVNWRSHQQVLAVLKELGLPVKGTNKEILRPLINRHRIVQPFLDYKEQSTLASTYGGKKWRGYIDQETGRIYPRWWQIGAGTGRMSCSRPNMQNLPRDGEYRKCLVAPEGKVLIRGDYNQIELRIAAEMSGDPEMIRAYQAAEDLHQKTAAYVTRKKSLEEVTSEERQLAKALNFGLIFGVGNKRLVIEARSKWDVKLTEAEAGNLRRKFFQLYSGLKDWQKRQTAKALRFRETRTIAGRRCLFPGKPRYTDSLNWPVQGAGADGIKLALANLWEKSGPEGALVVSVIHDEIVIEVPIERAEEAKIWLKDAMESAMREFLKIVPVVIKPEIIGT